MVNFPERDQHWMRYAIQLAEKAQAQNEVPVGAVLTLDNKLIGEGWNQPISHSDPTAHAEIMALRAGAEHLHNYRLLNTTLYVTLEPCMMCVGALLHARVKRLVFGALDPKAGAIASRLHLLDGPHNHVIEWEGGCLADQCGEMLKGFFQQLRE